jgi:ribonuclease HI
MKDELSIHTDGGSRGNPGPSACGFVVEEGDKLIYQANKFLGVATNNHAEYSGVLLALNWLAKQEKLVKTKTIVFYLDSELIVRQLVGVYKVKDENLKKLHVEAHSLIRALGVKVHFKNVPREKNKIADRLVNDSLDGNT